MILSSKVLFSMDKDSEPSKSRINLYCLHWQDWLTGQSSIIYRRPLRPFDLIQPKTFGCIKKFWPIVGNIGADHGRDKEWPLETNDLMTNWFANESSERVPLGEKFMNQRFVFNGHIRTVTSFLVCTVHNDVLVSMPTADRYKKMMAYIGFH